MFETLVMKQDEIVTGAVLDAFATMTEYHKENHVYFEGWKTNDCWTVNKKVILPYYAQFQVWGSFSVSYSYIESLNDIDRALCVASKRPYSEIRTVRTALENAFHANRTQPGETYSTFFRFRYFKKGTIHLYFLGDKVWEDFCLAAAKGRNWLPPGSESFNDKHTREQPSNTEARAVSAQEISGPEEPDAPSDETPDDFTTGDRRALVVGQQSYILENAT